MTGTVVRSPQDAGGSTPGGAAPPHRRWWWIVIALVVVLVAGGAVFVVADADDNGVGDGVPATGPAFVETPFHAVVERVTSAKTLAADIDVTRDWVQVEEVHYRDPSHWRRTTLEDRGNPWGPGGTGAWTVVGPEHIGGYDPASKTVSVEETAGRPEGQRRTDALGMLDREQYAGPDLRTKGIAKACRMVGIDRVAARRAARYSCRADVIPQEGLLPGARSHAWLDVETGYVLRVQLPNGSGVRVRRIEYRPQLAATLFAIAVPDGARTRWVGTAEPPEQYRVRELEVSSSIPLGGEGPRAVTVAEGSVWIADGGSNPQPPDGAISGGAVVRIDPRTEEVVARIPIPQQARRWPGQPDQPVSSAMEVIAGDGVLWVTDHAGFLYRLDPKTNSFVGDPVNLAALPPTGEYPLFPESAAYGDGSLWVARGDSTTVRRGGVEVGGVLSSVLRLDGTTGEVMATIPLEGWPGAIRFAHGSVWMAASATDERDPRGASRQLVHRIDPATNAVTAVISLDNSDAFGFGLAVDDERVWALVANDVVRIDPATNAVVAKMTVEGGAGRAASSGDALWVPNFDGTTVTRIDAASNEVTARLTTGEAPVHVAVGFDAVWVVNRGDKTLARIHL